MEDEFIGRNWEEPQSHGEWGSGEVRKWSSMGVGEITSISGKDKCFPLRSIVCQKNIIIDSMVTLMNR